MQQSKNQKKIQDCLDSDNLDNRAVGEVLAKLPRRKKLVFTEIFDNYCPQFNFEYRFDLLIWVFRNAPLYLDAKENWGQTSPESIWYDSQMRWGFTPHNLSMNVVLNGNHRKQMDSMLSKMFYGHKFAAAEWRSRFIAKPYCYTNINYGGDAEQGIEKVYELLYSFPKLKGQHLTNAYLNRLDSPLDNPYINGNVLLNISKEGLRIVMNYSSFECRNSGWDKTFTQLEGESYVNFLSRVYLELKQNVVYSNNSFQ